MEQSKKVAAAVDQIIEKLKLTSVHYYIVIAAALGFMFDSFDTYIVSYAMPAIVKEWNIDSVTNGLLTSAGVWGMFVGALFFGPLTDKMGRRWGFMATVIGFAALTGLTALSTNVTQFGIMRFLTGIFLGGLMPVDTALTSEYISTKYRGRFVSMLTLAWPFGMLIAAILSLWLVEDFGWRLLFIVGVFPAVLTIFIRLKVPESPRWLATQGRTEETKSVLKTLGASDKDLKTLPDGKAEKEKQVSVKVLLQPQYRKRFALTTGYYFFSYFGYYGFVLMFPSILSTVFGLSLAKTFTYTLLLAVSAILGRATAYYTIERFGRKQLFYVGFGLGGVAALLFGLLENPTYLIIGACILSYLYEQGVAGTVVYTPELYPSNVRATATSWSTGAGRISAALAPIVFGYFMQIKFYYGIYLTMALFFFIAVALVYFVGVETKGKSLKQVGAS